MRIRIRSSDFRQLSKYSWKSKCSNSLSGGEEEEGEEPEEDRGSERGEESVEVPVLVLPPSLKERLEADMKAILSEST